MRETEREKGREIERERDRQTYLARGSVVTRLKWLLLILLVAHYLVLIVLI